MDDIPGPAGAAAELDELLGAYALDAVDADERRRVEDYLAVNPRAAAEVQAHREVATMLAFTGMDAAIALVFVAFGQSSGTDAPDEPLAAAVEIARADRDSLVTTMVAEGSEVSAEAIIDQDGHGYVVGHDLPTLSAAQTYQLWGVVDNGDVISLGILGPNPEIETFTVDGRVSALAITIEQYPGVISDGNPEGAFVGSF